MLERREGESPLDYHRRLVYGKLVDHTLSDVDYTELAPLLYGQEYSTDVARRMCYGSRRTLELMDSVRLADTSTPLEQLNAIRTDIQKERYKLQSEKAEYNKWIREDARDELFMEKVLKAISEHVGEYESIEPLPVVHSERGAAICIADTHFGKDIKIYGLANEVLNEYNPEVFYSRMSNLYSDIIEVIDKEQLNTVHVYHLGDSVDGLLRHSQVWSLRYGVIDSAIIFGNYMGNWLRSLSEHVRVVYAQTDGNHDEIRLLDGKKGQHLNESAGKIVLNCIRLKNEGNPNLTVLENNTGLIFDNICGYNILGVHAGVRDITTATKEYSNTYNKDINYVISGHMHNAAHAASGVRKGAIQVGSLAGVDEFALSILKNCDATASTIVFENEKGKVAEYTHVLD